MELKLLGKMRVRYVRLRILPPGCPKSENSKPILASGLLNQPVAVATRALCSTPMLYHAPAGIRPWRNGLEFAINPCTGETSAAGDGIGEVVTERPPRMAAIKENAFRFSESIVWSQALCARACSATSIDC